jgi:hypothetical protein
LFHVKRHAGDERTSQLSADAARRIGVSRETPPLCPSLTAGHSTEHAQ